MAAKRRTIEDLRREIDRIDLEILERLERRAAVARKIGATKAMDGSTVYVPSREKKILDRLARRRKVLPAFVVRAVFREVISACRSLERGLRVSYLGPKGTFSHLAARTHFGAAVACVAVPSIPQVFEEVERGRVDYGVVPIENSTEGSVTHTLDRFLESSLLISAEVCLVVRHNLLSKTGEAGDVRRIVSVPQALAQCRRWLAANLPGAPLEEASSTAGAAERAKRDPDVAAVASSMAGEVYGLSTIAANIQDETSNATRFAVIGTEDSNRVSGDDKTSAVFSVHDEVGVLQRLLDPFARNGINLSRIESRPLRGRPWEYVFFLDFLGHRRERRVRRALESLEPICRTIRILGSYPVWRDE